MNEEQKRRAKELIENKDHAIGLHMMKQLLQELIDAARAAHDVDYTYITN